MPLSPAKARALRERAREGALDVEHIIEVAINGTPADVRLLEELVPDEAGPTSLIPWRRAAATFLMGGCEALLPYASQASRLPFVLGILENVKTPASVSTLLSLARRLPASSDEIIAALNLILSFDGAPTLSSELAADVRQLLHARIRAATSESTRAVAILALRGVGDETSISLLERQAPFESPYQNTLALVRKAIGKRTVARFLH